jgi:transposase
MTAQELRSLAKRLKDANQSRRLLSLAAVKEGRSRGEAAEIGGMDRQTLRDWVHRFNAEGLEGLCDHWSKGPASKLSAKDNEKLAKIVATGPDPAKDGIVRWRRVDLQRLIKERFGVAYHERHVGTLLKQMGFSHVSARPRQPADQRYENAWLFGAICPAKGKAAGLALPEATTRAMQLHLDEIARHVAKGAHAVVLLDRAGWHTTHRLKVPRNISLVFLPSRAPELNPVENIWQFLRANWLSNRVFETYDAIIDAACAAWRKLAAMPETIRSIGLRDWINVGQRS